MCSSDLERRAQAVLPHRHRYDHQIHLHDHCRKVPNWSKAQILVRFVLLRIGISALLIVMSLKIS